MLKSKKIPIDFSTNPGKFKKFHKIKLQKSIKFYSVSQKGTQFISNEIKFMPVKQLVSILKIIKLAIRKIVSRRARLFLVTPPNIILTKKPKDIRMGRGKGAPTDRVAVMGNKPLFSINKTGFYSKVKKLLNRCKKKVFFSKIIETNKW